MTITFCGHKDVFEVTQEISEAHQERMKPFTFSMCNIAVGEQIEFSYSGCDKSGTLCTVVDDKHVEYKWRNMDAYGLGTVFIR